MQRDHLHFARMRAGKLDHGLLKKLKVGAAWCVRRVFAQPGTHFGIEPLRHAGITFACQTCAAAVGNHACHKHAGQSTQVRVIHRQFILLHQP